MSLFLLFAALMLAAALAFVLVPLLRHRRNADASQARKLRALQDAREAGVLDAAEYERKRVQLGGPAPVAGGDTRSVMIATLLVAMLLPAAALLLYRVVGTPQALDPARLVAAATGEASGPQMEEAIAALAARLQQHPEDAEGWTLLGRAYQVTGRTTEALDAFRRAHEAAPDNAAASIEYAQALAMSKPDHRIDGEARKLLEQVVAADPTNQRALWLLGISDYQNKDFDAAIARWNTLLPLLERGSDVQASVVRQIAEAEALRDGKAPPAATDAAVTAATTSTDATHDAAPAAPAPRLIVDVSLAPALKSRLDPDATLFVYARAASGPPMPISIERLKASQLPISVTLDDSKGMLPNLKLGMFPEVVIGARISVTGNATPQSGDLEGASAPVDVHRSEPLELTIDRVVP